MNCFENGICATNSLSTETHKSFDGGKCLKHILTYLDSIKFNEINIGHSHLKNCVFY